MGWAAGFSAGTQMGRSAIDAYRQAQDYEERQKIKEGVAGIAAEKPTDAYTADQGAELEALANAKDANGNPAYTVGTDDTGKYTVTPNFQNETGATPQPYTPSTMAAKGVSFLGKNYDAPLSDAQTLGARQQAMAGVMERGGDIEGAMRYRQQAQQGELAAMQLEQAKRQGVREDKADANTAILEGVDKEAGAADVARRTGPDGVVRDATPDDHLKTMQDRAARLIQTGKLNEAGQAMKEANAMAFSKIQLDTEQRSQDMGRAASALANGDTSGIVDFYNKHVPDGAHVTKVTEGKDGMLTIERTTTDGRPLPPVTKNKNELLAGLNSFKDPMALYNFSQNEFKNNLAINADKRADKSLGIQQAQLGIAGNADRRAQTIFNTEAPVHEANAEIAKLKIALAKTEDPQEQAALTDKITALASGRRGASAQHDPADLIKANALVKNGVYPSQGEALDAIVSKPDKLYQSYKDAAMKITMNADGAIESAKKMMADDGWKKTSGGTWKRVGSAGSQVVGEFGSAADVEAAVKAGKVKPGDKVSVGGRTATWR